MNESQILAKHIANTDYDHIPAGVVKIAKNCFLDALAVMLAAGTLGEGCKEFVHLAVTSGGKNESTILGFDQKVPAAMAAFANGSMAHALDFEDAHDRAFVHPNAAAIPAALAVAESLGDVSGRDFLAAIILGSDLVCRLGLSLKEDLLGYGWYMPPILGAFGATTAVSKLLKLSEEQILDAFSLTLCQATCSGELIHNPQSVVRSIRDAFSAKAGVLSALLAREGIVGFKQPFEGKAGFFNLYARGNYFPDMLTDNLGKVFESANVSFKPWPSCRGTHSYVDAVLQIIEEHDLKPGDVKEIRAVVSPLNRMLCEPLETKQNPITAIDAKFSIPFVVATAIVYKRVALEHFSPQALVNREVLGVSRKVTYEVDDSFTSKSTMQSRLEVHTKNSVLSKRVSFPYGHPGNPMSQEALITKFMDCAGHSMKNITMEKLKDLVGLIMNLDEVENIAQITALL
ncbi:MAG: MmgE/PrpD family protein [Bacillota bacterium]|nr:MmgE/PrpD family protein [Bacillota bacterium]